MPLNTDLLFGSSVDDTKIWTVKILGLDVEIIGIKEYFGNSNKSVMEWVNLNCQYFKGCA